MDEQNVRLVAVVVAVTVLRAEDDLRRIEEIGSRVGALRVPRGGDLMLLDASTVEGGQRSTRLRTQDSVLAGLQLTAHRIHVVVGALLPRHADRDTELLHRGGLQLTGGRVGHRDLTELRDTLDVVLQVRRQSLTERDDVRVDGDVAEEHLLHLFAVELLQEQLRHEVRVGECLVDRQAGQHIEGRVNRLSHVFFSLREVMPTRKPDGH